jgi:hypothetical protein
LKLLKYKRLYESNAYVEELAAERAKFQKLLERKTNNWEDKEFFIRDAAYAMPDNVYGPPKKDPLKTIDENQSSAPGVPRMGITGRLGYHVLEVDRRFGLNAEARYVWRENYTCPTDVNVCVPKKYVVPRRIEEMICIETGLNAVSPLTRRVSVGTTLTLFGRGRSKAQFNQFEPVAWKSKLDKFKISVWRMGYVMWEFEDFVRVMIPSGMIYFLKKGRVVSFGDQFSKYDKSKDVDWEVPDSHFLPETELATYVDSDWDYPDDAADARQSANFDNDFHADTFYFNQKYIAQGQKADAKWLEIRQAKVE